MRYRSVDRTLRDLAVEALLSVVRERHKKCSTYHVGSGASRDIRECFALSALRAIEEVQVR
jgi:hypothetical protein